MPGTKDNPKMVITPPLEQLRSRYAARKAELKKMETPNRKVSIMLDQWVQQNFKSQGGKVGKWEGLKAGGRWKSVGSKRTFDPFAQILQDTGRLRSSFLPFASRTNAGIGSDIPYSRKHEYGEGKLPVRRMLPKYREVSAAVRQIYKSFVRRAFK